jgi:diguanylate cyclase (GGDEF)-like protein
LGSYTAVAQKTGSADKKVCGRGVPEEGKTLRGLGTIRVLICCLALSCVVQAQQYVFHTYRQAEGLKNLSVNAVVIDRFGFLWVATENGVYRFAGASFEQYGREQGIAELDAQNIVADANGTIWVGTEGNLYRWDGNRFLPAGKNPIKMDDQWRMAAEDATHLLVVDNQRLYRLEHDTEGRMLSYLPVITDSMVAANPELSKVATVSVVDEPNNGHRIWIGCGKRLYSFLDGEPGHSKETTIAQLTRWDKGNGLTEEQWQTVLLDRAGTLWAAGQEHVMALPRGATRFVDRSIPGSDPGNVYGHAPMIEDPEGRVLAPTEDGIARWEGAGWRVIGRQNGMQRTSHISGLAFDAAGDLWLSSRGNGVSHWVGYRDWEGWTDAQGLPAAMVWSVLPISADRLLVGTEKGPAWINPRNGTSGNLSSIHPWTYGQVDAMGVDADGSLWATTFSGAVLRIDQKNGKTEQTAKLPSLLESAMKDSTGRVFYATKPGIFVRDVGALKAPPHTVPAAEAALGGHAQIVASCQSADGADWFVTGTRLLREENGKWTVPPVDGQHALLGSFLALSCAADGTVWVSGDQTGTWRMTPAGDRLQAWQLQVPEDLRSLAVLSLLVDRRGWVWLGTDSGLLVWNGHAWRHLTEETGLIWNDLDQGVLTEAPDGSIWVGTSGGLGHLLHPEHVFDSIPLDVSVTGIQRENNLDAMAHQLTLPWSNLPLEFQISSSAMRNRSELIFKYRMAPLQPDWVESHDGRAVFSGLPPGNFTLMAMAYNPGLNAYSGTVAIQVKILPPWWKTRWFTVLLVVAVILLLLGADRLRARHMRARSRHLQSLVSERTRELEASREQLQFQATHDGITGLFNHVEILRVLAAEMNHARRTGKTLVLAMLDLDHFKRVNDVYGHLAGDEALRSFAAATQVAIRSYDHAGRYGGEEFLLILNEVPIEAAEQRLTHLHSLISNLKVRTGEFEFTITCSAGATVFDPSAESRSLESLLMAADQALYAAKSSGRNCVIFRDSAGLEADDESSSTMWTQAR